MFCPVVHLDLISSLHWQELFVVTRLHRMFEDVGGFPNKFWGWGGEDDALLRRTRAQGYAITWPRFGSYEDLERLTLQQKLQQLRTDKAKCMTKRELMALEPNSQDTLAQTPLCKALRIDKHIVHFN